MEVSGQHDEAGKNTELQDERSFQERPTDVLPGFGEGGIRRVSGTIAIEGFNYGGDGTECRQDAAWMDG